MALERKKIIDLISEGKSCNEICNTLGITNKQLYKRLITLKNNGFFFDRRYFSDGSISYIPMNSMKAIRDEVFPIYNSVVTKPNEYRVNALAISDIHFGSKAERLDLLDRAYNYCIKNGIHLIFICGDLIDGTFGGEKSIKNIERQINHFKNHYPFDKGIINFAVGGDHDMSALYSNNQDLITAVQNFRHDIVLTNYNNSFVCIKNDKILLHHHCNSGKMFDLRDDCPIMLIGHKHEYTILPMHNGNVLSIRVPSLSDINDSLPTAVELDMKFKNGSISSTLIKQIYFGDKDYILSEITHDFENRNLPYCDKIFHVFNYNFDGENKSTFLDAEEDFPNKEESKKKTLTQIEKFNKRYHIE